MQSRRGATQKDYSSLRRGGRQKLRTSASLILHEDAELGLAAVPGRPQAEDPARMIKVVTHKRKLHNVRVIILH